MGYSRALHYAGALAASILLTACEATETAEDVAADAAADAVAESGLETRIDELEGRLDDLETTTADQASAIDAIHDLDEDQAAVANDNDEMLDRRIRAIEDRLRM